MNAEVTRYIAEREEILGTVRALLIERLHVQRAPGEIDPDVPLFGSGLGLDSIDAVEFVLVLEERFGLRLTDDFMTRSDLRTVNTVVDAVLAHSAANVSR